jgi:hypothetical protein
MNLPEGVDYKLFITPPWLTDLIEALENLVRELKSQ